MSNYWTDRQKELYSALEKDENELKIRLASLYEEEYSKMDREIAAYYQKYGKNNVIEYRELMQTLSADDAKMLIEQIDDFVGKYPQYAHLVPVRTSIYKLDRLEGLQYSVRMHQFNIGAVNQQEITEYLNKQVLRGVNAAREAMGFGKNFYHENADVLKLFVDVPWCNGKNFSRRIWDNCDKLSNYLTTDIAQGFARGDSYQKLTKQLQTRFESVSKKDAYRLIYTEGTYVMAESTIQPFEEDFDEYRISTVSDGKVCSICSSIAKEKFKIKERKAGVNFPPFHSWCRCTYVIAEPDDWEKWMDDYVKRHNSDKSQSEKVLNNVCGNGIMNPAGKSPYSNKELVYNPNAKYNVNLNGLSKVVNDGLSNACRKVAEAGYLDGKEHLSMVDLKTGTIVYNETGLSSQVGGGNFWKFISENKNGSFAFVHNHNNPTHFSETDLSTLTSDNCIDMFIISRYDGKIFVLESNGKIKPKSFFDEIYVDEMNELSLKMRNGQIEPVDRARIRETILVNNAIRDFTKGVKEFG